MKKLLIFLIALMLIPLVVAQCTESWQCLDWKKCLDGMTERSCFDLNSCGILNESNEQAQGQGNEQAQGQGSEQAQGQGSEQAQGQLPSESASCSEALPLCYDGIWNQDETDVDCGGKICERCSPGKSCFVDGDCQIGACTNRICYGAEQAGVEPVPSYPGPINFSAVLRIVAYILVVIAAIAAVFAIIIVMKRLKKRKIIILTSKKERVKEVISTTMPASRKKSKLAKFAENMNGYLKSIKPEPKLRQKIEITGKGKDLLNKNPYKRQSSTKEFMLSNLKEAYENE
jgi:hypothetical protein